MVISAVVNQQNQTIGFLHADSKKELRIKAKNLNVNLQGRTWKHHLLRTKKGEPPHEHTRR